MKHQFNGPKAMIIKTLGILLTLELIFADPIFDVYSAPNNKKTMLLDLPAPAKNKCLKVGTIAPDFTVTLVSGEQWNLKKHLKAKSVVLVFYRGGWCPFCNLQLRSYERKLKSFRKAGASLLAISVDRIDKKIPKPTKQLNFSVASDPELKTIKSYNVTHVLPDRLVKQYKRNYDIDLEASSGLKHHTIAMPAVVVIDQTQRVRWCYANENYKIRPATDVILRKLRELR